jgi:MATE family multidrug resistance protein
MAGLFACFFLLLHAWISEWVFSFSDASDQVKLYGQQYFSIRVWSAPAALANFVILGWLLGTQNAKAPMWIVIVSNLSNIVLDIVFVMGLGWKVQGVAIASVLADYIGMALGLWFVYRTWKQWMLPPIISQRGSLLNGIGRFVRLNRDIFLRSLCLQTTFTFMTFQGASFGDDVVAANAVLMSFLMIISYGMDGFAYAMEAMVGKAIGAKDKKQLTLSLIGTFFWSAIICMVLTVVFACGGSYLISMITDIPVVREHANVYLPWLIAMPLISMWCFLLDGIFIGATKAKEMRNSMFVATCGYFLIFFVFSGFGNHALWLAMVSFMGMRGLGLAVLFVYQWRRNLFLA